MSKDEFDLILAEMKAMLGSEPIFAALEQAARRYGWPIPPKHRHRTLRYIVAELSKKPPKATMH